MIRYFAVRRDLTAALKTCLMNRMKPHVETARDTDAIAIKRTLAGIAMPIVFWWKGTVKMSTPWPTA